MFTSKTTTFTTCFKNMGEKLDKSLGNVFKHVDTAMDAVEKAVDETGKIIDETFKDLSGDVAKLVCDDMVISVVEGNVIINGTVKSLKINGAEVKLPTWKND